MAERFSLHLYFSFQSPKDNLPKDNLVDMINFEQVEKEITSIAGLQVWPEVDTILAEHKESVPSAWQLPAYSCYAVGEDETAAAPAVAAMGCLQKSIIFIDDILDDEPDGLYQQMGVGRTANLSMALHAASLLLLDRCNVAVERRDIAKQTLSQLAMQTSVGQEMDVQNIEDESDYWRVVQGKSVPFYAEGFRLGAQLWGTTDEQVDVLGEIGGLFGEIIQIHDDLEDAFAVPAKPDWERQQNNLLILYGISAEYPQRSRFLELAQGASELSNLQEAQQILIQSGAVSYAIYQAVVRENRVHELLQQAQLPRPEPITELFTRHRTPLVHFLQDVGVEAPSELFAMR